MSMVERICKNPQCCKPFKAREADVKRGWGKFCSKRCKAVKQELKTGQFREYIGRTVSGDRLCFPSMAEGDVQ